MLPPKPWDVAKGLAQMLRNGDPDIFVAGEEHSVSDASHLNMRSRDIVLDIEDERGQTYEVTLTVLRVQETQPEPEPEPNKEAPAMTERQKYLLRMAALVLRDQRDPFCEQFLVDHEVTSDEVAWLSATVGDSVLAFLAAAEK